MVFHSICTIFAGEIINTISSNEKTAVDDADSHCSNVLPIGMSQISSVNFVDDVKVGDKVTKGQEMGWFLFGGSDIVYLFQNKVSFTLETTDHQLQGEKLGKLTKK